MGEDVRLALEFYRPEDGRYPGEPNTTRVVALDGVPSHSEPGWVPPDIVLRGPTYEDRRTQGSWPRAFNRTVLIGDVTGDGRPDLLIEPEFRELHVFIGVEGPEMFDPRPQKVAVILPGDEEYTWLTDLNNDGRQDILLHHRFTLRDAHGALKRPPGAEPQRVTIRARVCLTPSRAMPVRCPNWVRLGRLRRNGRRDPEQARGGAGRDAVG